MLRALTTNPQYRVLEQRLSAIRDGIDQLEAQGVEPEDLRLIALYDQCQAALRDLGIVIARAKAEAQRTAPARWGRKETS